MSSSPVSTSGLVRVTVTSATRRVDLALPAVIPVAELLPELARSVGLLDSGTVHGGYRMVTADGRPLAGDMGLTVQGVEDGAVLAVTAGIDAQPRRVYDDVVEAMTDVVEHDRRPWQPASSRRTALSAAILLMTLGAVALLIQRGSVVAAVTAATVAVALVTGAVVLSRVQDEDGAAAVVVAWMGTGYAAVAGLVLAPDGDLFADPIASAGGGSLAAGLMCLVGLRRARALVIPPLVVGAIFLGIGLLPRLGDVDAAVLLTVILTLIVMVGSVFPWLALGVTGAGVDQLYLPADLTTDPDEIDPGKVGADAQLAHEILVAICGAVGLLLVLIAPLAVSLGLAGTLLAVVACLVMMLRTRQYRFGSEVLVGLGSGIGGLAAVAVSLMLMHPAWRPVTAMVLVATGAVLLTTTLLPTTPSVRRGRFGDIVETLALLALLPLLVLATGLFAAITP